MRRTTLIGFAAAAALVVVGLARAATVGVTTTVTGGGALTVTALNSPSFSLTLNGDDQTSSYQAQLQVVDARGLASGGGWNLTIAASQFGDGAGHTIPSNAQTMSSVTQGCHSGSTCTVASNSVSNTSLAIPGSATKFLNAANQSGLGRVDVDVNVSVAVPANTIAATYSSTLTVAIAAGP